MSLSVIVPDVGMAGFVVVNAVTVIAGPLLPAYVTWDPTKMPPWIFSIAKELLVAPAVTSALPAELNIVSIDTCSITFTAVWFDCL